MNSQPPKPVQWKTDSDKLEFLIIIRGDESILLIPPKILDGRVGLHLRTFAVKVASLWFVNSSPRNFKILIIIILFTQV